MRGKLSKVLRSGLSLMLVLCMVVAMAPAAFAAEVDSDYTYYVALGDGSSVSASYVDQVGAALDVPYNNLSVEGQYMVDAPAYIAENAKEIAKADLVTIGYGGNGLIWKAFLRANAAMNGEEYETYDWVATVGEEGAAQVAEVLAKVKATMIEKGLDQKYGKTDVATAGALAAEAFGYYAYEYIQNLPVAIAAIREINPDADIMVLGMYNPMRGAILQYNYMAIAADNYLGDVVQEVDEYGRKFCKQFDGVYYISATETQTDCSGQRIDLRAFMRQYASSDNMLDPNAAGHAYIKNQILDKVDFLTLGENPFYDVAETNYFYTPVLWAVKNGITGGLNATTFGPNNACTRGQVVTFLWRANGSPEPKSTSHPFTDISEGQYYYKAVLWAVENGITSGLTATTFGPNNACTRGQIATFLWRANGSPEPQSSNNPFSDVNAGPFYKAILWAVDEGVTGGYSDGTFRPNNVCTRGNIVTFLYRAEQ